FPSVQDAALSQSEKPKTFLEHLETRNRTQFKEVTRFGFIGVMLSGLAESQPDSGQSVLPTREQIQNIVLKQYANDFANFKYQALSTDSIQVYFSANDSIGSRVGFILARVSFQPIIIDVTGIREYLFYQVTVTSGTFHSLGVWQHATSRIVSRENLFERLTRDLQNLIDDLAIDFFKGKGEM
ncbi:MAG: hypothetical protein P8Y60_11140, partial [Calditrichota bacterium]